LKVLLRNVASDLFKASRFILESNSKIDKIANCCDKRFNNIGIGSYDHLIDKFAKIVFNSCFQIKSFCVKVKFLFETDHEGMMTT
jgi:hypothetical protein